MESKTKLDLMDFCFTGKKIFFFVFSKFEKNPKKSRDYKK